jgi:hypothetical protein
MTDNVVTFAPPTGDPEIIEDFRTLLSEANNGRIVSYVTVRIDNNGRVYESHFYDNTAHELALNAIVTGIEDIPE